MQQVEPELDVSGGIRPGAGRRLDDSHAVQLGRPGRPRGWLRPDAATESL
jgi:hypothetical protein